MSKKPIAIAAMVFWLISLVISILDLFVGFVFLQAAIGIIIASVLLE